VLRSRFAIVAAPAGLVRVSRSREPVIVMDAGHTLTTKEENAGEVCRRSSSLVVKHDGDR
jgi:hypothetical protein